MVTFRYDNGEGRAAELEPLDGEFNYVEEGQYWSIKVEETEDGDTVKWIPRERIYEIEGRRERIRNKVQS